MRRFDITVEGHHPDYADREYCADGEFVDAADAERLLAALQSVQGLGVDDTQDRIINAAIEDVSQEIER